MTFIPTQNPSLPLFFAHTTNNSAVSVENVEQKNAKINGLDGQTVQNKE